jgi:DNA-binding CsgD family transcriptional regulator
VGGVNAGPSVPGVIRQRLLDGMRPLAPLTVLCGVPGTAKSELIRQLAGQMAADAGSRRNPVVLVDFPRRHLGDVAALAFAIDAVIEVLGPGIVDSGVVSDLHRGRVDLGEFAGNARRRRVAMAGASLLLMNYEWQSSSGLDGILVEYARAGLDVVCSLVDATPLRDLAQAQGVTVRVIDDEDLRFRAPELETLARSLGIEPSEELIARVEEMTAGLPDIAAVMMLQLAGVERVVVERGEARILRRDARGEFVPVDRPGAGAQDHRAPLRHVDPGAFQLDDLRRVVAAMRYRGRAVGDLFAGEQGSSGFVRFLDAVLEVPQVDVDALEDLLPGCGVFVQRLVSAGYARLELWEDPVGRLVWSEGFRIVAREWRRNAAAGRPVDSTGGFPVRLAQWCAERDRYAEAVEVLRQTGDNRLLERFAASRFVDLIVDGRTHGLASLLPASAGAAASCPSTTVLSALEAHPLARDDRDIATVLEALLPQLSGGFEDPDPLVRLRSVEEFLVAAGALDRWEDAPGAEERGIDALEECLATGRLMQGRAAKEYAFLGMIALLRADIVAARRALTRSVAVSVPGSRDFRIAATGLILLEGYFGEFLFDRSFDRARLLEEELPLAQRGERWQGSLVVTRLARSWTLVWNGSYDEGLEEIVHLVREAPRAVVHPIVVWTQVLELLLTGRPAEARALVRGVDRRVADLGHPPRQSPVFVLGATLACVADGRLPEALGFASRRRSHEGVLDEVTQMVLATASGQKTKGPGPAYFDPDQAPPSARASTLLTCVWIAACVHSGHGAQAVEAMHGLAASASPIDVDFACRFMTREDTVRLRDLAESVAPGSVSEAIAHAVDGPHAVVEDLAVVSLSGVQLAVVDGLRRGLRNQEIADELYLSVNTVKTHLRTIYRKLGASNRAEAVALAETFGLLDR